MLAEDQNPVEVDNSVAGHSDEIVFDEKKVHQFILSYSFAVASGFACIVCVDHIVAGIAGGTIERAGKTA